jgi:predicted permease
LREGGRGGAADRSGHFLRRAFVVAEFGLALSLLAGAGLLLRSFARIQSVDPGFNAESVLTATLVLPSSTYADDASRIAFFDRAIAQVEAIPGVVSVGATNILPFGGSWATGSFGIEGYQPAEGEPMPWGDQRRVSPGFAEAMGVEVLRGRFLEERDAEGSPLVAVVDDEMVRRYFADTDPIGRRLLFGRPDDPNAPRPEIVGVVAHTAHEGLDAEKRLQVYVSYRQRASGVMTLTVRTQGDPMRQLAGIRQAISSIDPNQPLSDIALMTDRIDESVGQRRMAMLLLAAFAAIGLLLAATGIYGVMSYNVSQRSQEMGVRMALGAGRADVLRIVLRQGLALAGIGTAIGIAGALALTRALQSQLYEVGAGDPATFVAVTVLLFAIGTVATLVPALRATRLDPVRALRQE